MTRSATTLTRRNGGTAVTTMDRVPDGVWCHVALIGRLAALLDRSHSEARLPALLTVIHPHLGDDGTAPGPAPHLVDVGLVRQLSRLLGADRAPGLLLAVLTEIGPHLRQPRDEQIDPPPGDVALSPREIEVLRGMARGRTNAGIGSELGLSEDTVKTHARNLFRKLSAHDRAHAVNRGWQLGTLDGAA